jgi:hypothetical protein
VEVGQAEMDVTHAAPLQVEPERADPRAGIEDEGEVVVDRNLDAGGVAPEGHGFRSWSRD